MDSRYNSECDCYFAGDSNFHYDSPPSPTEDRIGMMVTSGKVTLQKDTSNIIGIRIAGGAPRCPCVFVDQVFNNTPASTDGTLESGDEIVRINKVCVKGRTKGEVARMILESEKQVTIYYNKLHADPRQGKTLDIILKKVKHRLVEKISKQAADFLGVSRAILCNDSLVKRVQDLEGEKKQIQQLIQFTQKFLKAYSALLEGQKSFGDTFAKMGSGEPQATASEAYRAFGEKHRRMSKFGSDMLDKMRPVLSDLTVYIEKAIPDMKMTIRKYADAKFEYLSYCLKVKEMEDEEAECYWFEEPMYRVETGNYEFRLVLRCREKARMRFAAIRTDVVEKLGLLENKRVLVLILQLCKLTWSLVEYHKKMLKLYEGKTLFPVDVDLFNSSNNCDVDASITSQENIREYEEFNEDFLEDTYIFVEQ